MQSMCQLDYVTSCRHVNVFTDHRNLVYLYDPVNRNQGVPRHTANKLLRWAPKLSSFQYIIDHLSDEENVWGDLLSIWANGPTAAWSQEEARAVDSRKVNVSSLLLAAVTPAENDDFDMPKKEEVKAAQAQGKAPDHVAMDATRGLFLDKDGRVWISAGDQSMNLRIMIAAHCTCLGVGHRGVETTLAK